LKNLCCQSLSELKVELRKAKERLRHKRDVILGCIRQPGFVLQVSVLRSVEHASITMTLDRYSHWIASMGRRAAEGMDEALA